MIEQGCNHANSTVKKMTDFFETRVKNLEAKEAREAKKTSVASFKKKKG